LGLVGISLGAAALPEPERDWLAAVEALPVDSVWQGGHVLPPSATGEAITRLALMTAWTERVRVGTAVLVLPLYHPVVVAKQLADLDARSGGRVTVGVGAGGDFAEEFAAVGVPVAERGRRTDEGIDALRELWSGDRLRPVGPMQPGGPPIVVAGRKEAAMRRAAQRGDGWMPYLVSADAYARSVAAIGEVADDFEWCLYLYCSIRADGDRAREDVRSFLGRAYGDKDPAMLDRIAPAGTPDEVAAKVQAYVDAGARHVIVAPAAHEDTLEVVRLAATEVLPQLVVP
jgi:alkanesulfonate monooxygenase SsuD/methylene tetrahydromethanopterin reductase-like flavin-dependent oxidoreductase (luciferase family)